ncbi:MAG TPA: DUF2007 domain-containing protein, partial [bacterium]|nr:DUF2007 domain-containing protein [bacterium]
PSQHQTTNNQQDVLLFSAQSNIEAKMIVTLLEAQGIPCRQISRGAGGYLNIALGSNMFGEDLYVTADMFDQAKKILQENLATMPEANLHDDSAQDQSLSPVVPDQKQQKRARLILWCLFGIPFVLIVILMLLVSFLRIYHSF